MTRRLFLNLKTRQITIRLRKTFIRLGKKITANLLDLNSFDKKNENLERHEGFQIQLLRSLNRIQDQIK